MASKARIFVEFVKKYTNCSFKTAQPAIHNLADVLGLKAEFSRATFADGTFSNYYTFELKTRGYRGRKLAMETVILAD